MITFDGLDALGGFERDVCLAIGVFDGVHLGHREVIRVAGESARNSGGALIVMTFDPHPGWFFSKAPKPLLINGLGQKLNLFKNLGVDGVCLCCFDEAFADLSATDFANSLIRAGQRLVSVAIGEDWHFGKGRKGDVDYLANRGREAGFEVSAVTPVRTDEGEVISSTLIRTCLQAGQFDQAEALLGSAFRLSGIVEKGEQLGRKLGFPTANIGTPGLVLPPFGVYVVQAHGPDGQALPGIANLGVRPTLEGVSAPRLEVHLFDFVGDLYGQKLEIEFLKLLRPEMKFSGLDELKAQIEKDSHAARACFRASDGGLNLQKPAED